MRTRKSRAPPSRYFELISQDVGPFPWWPSRIFQAIAGVALLLLAAPALSQVAPDLGTAGNYTVLGTNEDPTTGTVTCTTSTIDGNVGTTGNVITDTGPCDITGDTDAPVAAEVVTDFNDAYDALDTLNPDSGCTPMPTGIVTVKPGVYCSAAGTTYGAGDIFTLDGGADDVWVFKIGTDGTTGALTGGAGFEVVMGGTADACNVYWWTAEAATMTGVTSFAGNVLSGTAATMTDTIWEARALATTDVTLTDSEITGCPEAVATGTIIVEKQTNPPGSLQDFTFTGDAEGSLTGGQQIVVDDLAPGNYTSTESVLQGWEPTDILCNDAGSSGDIETATANFVLDAGQTVTCVFFNTELGATDGTIAILKQANPPDTGQSFDFTGDLGNFSLMHGELFIVETRPPGTYAVSETVPPGWQLESATCS